MVSNIFKRRARIRKRDPIYFHIRYSKGMILPTIFIYLSLCMKDLSYLYVFRCIYMFFCCILIQGLVNDVTYVSPKAEHK